MAFISDAIYPSTEQAGNDAFDHRPAVAAGASEVHLVGSALSVQTRVVQDPAHLLLRWGRRDGFDCVRDADRENPARVQCLTQCRVVEGHIASQRVDSQGMPTCHLRDGMLYFVDQGQHITIITGVPYRKMGGKDETRGGLGNNAGFAAKLGRTIALAFANRRNGAIVGIDNFTRGQRLAMGEAPRLVLNQLMRLDGCGEGSGQARVLARREPRSVLQNALGR